MSIHNEIQKMLSNKTYRFIFWNVSRTEKNLKHKCLYCSKSFKARSKYHQLCSSRCYSAMHRIPGFIRNLIKNTRD